MWPSGTAAGPRVEQGTGDAAGRVRQWYCVVFAASFVHFAEKECGEASNKKEVIWQNFVSSLSLLTCSFLSSRSSLESNINHSVSHHECGERRQRDGEHQQLLHLI
jgi:hypothetical protein